MYDLIIAGAGPAGSAAARTAAKMGLNTLILEKDAFPRYKPCGGAISERSLSILDFSLPEDLCERAVTGARVHFRDQVLESHKSYRLATLVNRSLFDQFLLQKAIEATADLKIQKVLDYRESDDHVAVFTREDTYRSRFLVISSGCQDGLKDRIRPQDRKDQFGICMVADIEEADEVINRRLHDVLDIHFGVAEMGYGWIFPHKGYYSVGIGGLADRLHHPRTIMQKFLGENGFPGRYRLHGHLIPMGGMDGKVASSRVMLAGDSAGFVDGFSGEGIYYAIRSGQIAANAVSEKLSDESLRLAAAYSSRCKEDFGNELKYALMLSRAVHSRPEMLLRILSSQGEVLERYMEVLAGRRSYKNFVHWMAPRLCLSVLRSI